MNHFSIQNIRTILNKHKDNKTPLLAVMEELQSYYGYLPREMLIMVSERLDVPLSQVHSVATFYHGFSLHPQGEHVIQACTGTACHVRGGIHVLDHLKTKLNIQAGETTSDLEYTLETINCLGACAVGPTVVTDGKYEGHMTTSKIDHLLEKIEQES
ncbi:MAG: hypothetical protein B6242_03780 [Anaerolineaceae bacterium 4572_78]|nr:MAG: hypothetical protein B6242_03780 [Anaerolineaceae bacterium 4572_78]